MEPYDKTIATWNSLASLYESKFMDLPYYDATYVAFCMELQNETPQLLELGCGPGNITKKIVEIVPKATLLATEVSPNMIVLAQKNVPTAQFRVLDARNFSTLEDSYDGIILGFCIPYLNEVDCDALLLQCSEKLTTNGVLYISFVEGPSDKSGYKTGNNGDSVYFYYHQLQRLHLLLNQLGLKQLEHWQIEYPSTKNASEWHTVLLLKKE